MTSLDSLSADRTGGRSSSGSHKTGLVGSTPTCATRGCEMRLQTSRGVLSVNR
jgi:hypothetical protein